MAGEDKDISDSPILVPQKPDAKSGGAHIPTESEIDFPPIETARGKQPPKKLNTKDLEHFDAYDEKKGIIKDKMYPNSEN